MSTEALTSTEIMQPSSNGGAVNLCRSHGRKIGRWRPSDMRRISQFQTVLSFDVSVLDHRWIDFIRVASLSAQSRRALVLQVHRHSFLLRLYRYQNPYLSNLNCIFILFVRVHKPGTDRCGFPFPLLKQISRWTKGSHPFTVGLDQWFWPVATAPLLGP